MAEAFPDPPCPQIARRRATRQHRLAGSAGPFGDVGVERFPSGVCDRPGREARHHRRGLRKLFPARAPDPKPVSDFGSDALSGFNANNATFLFSGWHEQDTTGQQVARLHQGIALPNWGKHP
ncbi:hypothetical protein MESS2_1590071 [Mesorhizobium metallidurans STM 2683]|uniref:Uncharacterized protein n=1 Tax=Mesorhizobium metallidurans STM 2683 TaxID=1297569 RepID=M5ELD8_9HYPH|nr:hypothetical protein MESS2_1590071 [Mesorhizobium metallidurans STM 2683]